METVKMSEFDIAKEPDNVENLLLKMIRHQSNNRTEKARYPEKHFYSYP